nr:MAG TPA: hypothetical protein [Caudoviricetes sp.]
MDTPGFYCLSHHFRSASRDISPQLFHPMQNVPK